MKKCAKGMKEKSYYQKRKENIVATRLPRIGDRYEDQYGTIWTVKYKFGMPIVWNEITGEGLWNYGIGLKRKIT
jgi:hypothetical protein